MSFFGGRIRNGASFSHGEMRKALKELIAETDGRIEKARSVVDNGPMQAEAIAQLEKRRIVLIDSMGALDELADYEAAEEVLRRLFR